MGIVIRQSIKSSVVTYAGVVIGTLNVLWLSPKFLAKEEIGLLQFVVDISLLYAALVQLGAPQIAMRFFPQLQQNNVLYRQFLGFLAVLPLAGLVLFTSAYFLLEPVFANVYRQESPLLIPYYYYLLPLTFFFVYIQLLESFARMNLRIAVPALIRELFLKLFNALLIIGYGLDWLSLNQFVMLLVASYGLAALFLLLYIRQLRIGLSFDFAFIRRPFFAQMIRYGLFVFMGGLGTLLVYKIDALMLSAYEGGVGSFGVYTIAFKIAIVIEIPRRAIAQITLPLLSTAWRDNNLKEIEALYQKSALNQLIVGLFLFLGIWCNIDAIFNLLPNGEAYRAGKYVVLFVALSRLIDMATGPNSEIIFGSKYYKFDLIGLVFLAILTVVANRLLIPLLGINGAAVASLLVIVVFNAAKLSFIWWKFNMQPFTAKTLLALLVGSITFASAVLVPSPSGDFWQNLSNIALRSAVIVVLYTALVFFGRVSEDANGVVFSLFRKLKGLRS